MANDRSGTSSRSVRGFLGIQQRSGLVAIALVGVMITTAGSWWLWNTEQADSTRALETRTQVVVDSTRSALSDVSIRLASVAGLFQASDSVVEIEFRRFVRKFGLVPGLEAIGYMPLVLGRNRDAFEAEMQVSMPGYEIFEISESGGRIPAEARRSHAPLLWYEPTEAFDHIAGFDSLSDPDREGALELARTTRGLAVSPFIRLVSEDEEDGFVMYWPVTDAANEAFLGYAVAAMDLSQLMDDAVSDALDPLIDWEVVDVTESIDALTPAAVGSSRIEVGGRTWEIRITPTTSSDMTADPTAALLLLVTGLLATTVVTVAVHTRRKQRLASEEFQQLRELTQAKDQFLASIGHELRTPLTSVLGFAELLRGDTSDLSEEERLSMISSVADEAMDLASIVDDLLVAARSELDLLVVTQVPVSTRAQVAQVLEASGKGTIEMIPIIGEPENPYRALGDPGRVRQILRNLITNARRYGGDRVEVRLNVNAEHVSVVVADNGDGVPEADRDEIFTAYYRAHSSQSQPAALGIGLSVARQLARLMNGDLAYRRADGWTFFELQLPVADDPDGRPQGQADTGRPRASSPVGVS